MLFMQYYNSIASDLVIQKEIHKTTVLPLIQEDQIHNIDDLEITLKIECGQYLIGLENNYLNKCDQYDLMVEIKLKNGFWKCYKQPEIRLNQSLFIFLIMKNKCIQTDISYFRCKTDQTQTIDHDFEQASLQQSYPRMISIKEQFLQLQDIYPYDIHLNYEKEDSIQFQLQLKSFLDEQSTSQIVLLIKGPAFSIDVLFNSTFLQDEKQEILNLVSECSNQNLLETIIQLETKLTEMDKEFIKRRAVNQFKFVNNYQQVEQYNELQITRGISNVFGSVSEELDMKQSVLGFDIIKDHLVEKYDNTEPQFNPVSTALPIEQLSQLQACSFSRFQQDFDEIQLIGSGGFGKVFKSRNKFDGNYYALKRIVLDYSNKKLTEKTKNEAVLLSRIQHPNIVRYYQAWTEEYIKDQYENIEDDEEFVEDSEEESEEEDPQMLRKGSSISQEEYYEDDTQFEDQENNDMDFQIEWVNCDPQIQEESIQTPEVKAHEPKQNSNKQLLYIQMEYCTGDTLKKKIDERNLTSEQKKKIIRQILDALYYLHKNNIIHRDLKPQNIFLDGDLNVKLGDFGLATEMKQEIKFIDHKLMRNSSTVQNNQSQKLSLTSGVGTFLYLAPEQEQSQYDSKVDIYSLGIILFETYYPFKTDMERINYITQLREQCKFPKDFDQKVGMADNEIREKITALVNKDPQKRPTTQSLLNEYKDKRVQQVIRSIANPNCPDFNELVQTLFECKQLKQQNNFFTSCLEEAISQSPTLFFKNFQSGIIELYTRVEKIFKLRGAFQLNLNPLIPTQNTLKFSSIFGQIEEYENCPHQNSSFRYITQEGELVQYCQNLLQPVIYWLKLLPLNNLRRYTLGEVQHSDRLQLSKHNCASYDIISEQDPGPVKLIELLSISRHVINQFHNVNNFELKISHTQFFELILLELDFNSQTVIRMLRHQTILQKIAKLNSIINRSQQYRDLEKEIFVILSEEFNFTDDKTDKFLGFMKLKIPQIYMNETHQQMKNSESGRKTQEPKQKRTLREQLKGYFTKQEARFQQIISEIEKFEELAKETKVLCDFKIVYEVFQMNELWYYYSGICFEFVEITKELTNLGKNMQLEIIHSRSEPVPKNNCLKRHQKGNIDSFIIGGNYSHYINNKDNGKHACGIQIYMDQFYYRKFVNHLNNNFSGRVQKTFDLFNWPDSLINFKSLTLSVLIVVEDLSMKQALDLAVRFWNHGIATMIVYIKSINNSAWSYKRSVEIKLSLSKKFNEVKCIMKKYREKKEEEVPYPEIFQKTNSYLREYVKNESVEYKVSKRAQSKQKQ
ncbi:unnamed protein product (macronuclear) [Paramecium tetraurelia]|uniref:non-specific serine/threonine protein kinase n=1 Tax=Paramecium tetraurelia TaxID=5888 RepID=A0CA48_PARTE|nr:uncharacterized protein GSPATT00036445001 [Paramecium tetraurelia]CAK67665.1 unnamed protein product [Paramecium tetraurelia]|eukprot:XP_001435062.1 hypothetical protein (macronuclear) [Paramecium tetraurelia strain d4-2]